MSNFFSYSGNTSNFFSSSDSEQKDNSLKSQYDNLQTNYEQIFIEAAESIRKELDEFKPENPCDKCTIKNCNIEKKDIFSSYPMNCKYREWQLKALAFLSGDYKQKLKIVHKSILDKKEGYNCSKCAACCKLAVSEYSYEQLKQRAIRGDKFSEDFVSVFIPYKTEDEARNVNPEYFALINKLVEDDKLYYYYCPKLQDNLCSIYNDRPDICKNFPHNPLKLLPSSCSYNAWRNEVSHQAMLLKAKVDIIAFYKSKLG